MSLAGDRLAQADDRPGGLAPSVLEGLVFGSMVGQLARRTLGHSDPPLPHPPGGRLSIVVTNLDDVAAEWGLPVDEVRLWACLRDVAHTAVLGVPHVGEALSSRLASYAASFDIPPDALAEELEEVDPADPGSFRAALGDPDHLVAAVQTPAQADVLTQLEALVVVVEGWVDQVVDGIGRRLLPSYPSLQEAVRRRRAEATWGDRYVARLLGMGLRQPAYQRGRHFGRGRAGTGGGGGTRPAVGLSSRAADTVRGRCARALAGPPGAPRTGLTPTPSRARWIGHRPRCTAPDQ